MQHEITESKELLDENGNLAEPGFAKKMLPVYEKSKVKAGKMKLKEWDYYLISNGHFALAATVDDNGYMSMDTVTFMHFDEGWRISRDILKILSMGKANLPETSVKGDAESKGRDYLIRIKNDGSGKRIVTLKLDKLSGVKVDVKGQSLEAEVVLEETGDESMVIATPFPKPAHFYFNQKINCLRAAGQVKIGEKVFTFDPADSFAVLDWGRGVWTYHNTWYWGSASYQVDGVPFGWNIGYGFGDTSAATENMLFYNGKAHKLSHVQFNIPGDDGPAQPGCADTVNTDEETRKKKQKDGKPDFMGKWTFTSDDGRFEMEFVPDMDRATCTDLGVIKSDQHQVFGKYSGRAVLDDGTVITVKDFPGFAEKVENKW